MSNNRNTNNNNLNNTPVLHAFNLRGYQPIGPTTYKGKPGEVFSCTKNIRGVDNTCYVFVTTEKLNASSRAKPIDLSRADLHYRDPTIGQQVPVNTNNDQIICEMVRQDVAVPFAAKLSGELIMSKSTESTNVTQLSSNLTPTQSELIIPSDVPVSENLANNLPENTLQTETEIYQFLASTDTEKQFKYISTTTTSLDTLINRANTNLGIINQAPPTQPELSSSQDKILNIESSKQDENTPKLNLPGKQRYVGKVFKHANIVVNSGSSHKRNSSYVRVTPGYLFVYESEGMKRYVLIDQGFYKPNKEIRNQISCFFLCDSYGKWYEGPIEPIDPSRDKEIMDGVASGVIYTRRYYNKHKTELEKVINVSIKPSYNPQPNINRSTQPSYNLARQNSSNNTQPSYNPAQPPAVSSTTSSLPQNTLSAEQSNALSRGLNPFVDLNVMPGPYTQTTSRTISTLTLPFLTFPAPTSGEKRNPDQVNNTDKRENKRRKTDNNPNSKNPN